MKINILAGILILIAALVVGGLGGYYLMPEKVTTLYKNVEVKTPCSPCIQKECKPIIKEVIKVEKCKLPSGFEELRQLQQKEKKAVDKNLHQVNYSKVKGQLYAGP